MGPSVILDKSALQALSVDEAVWLEAFLDAIVVPPFYVEVLADLEKAGRQDQSPEAVVGRLAEKTPSNAYPNVHHRALVLEELAGRKIEMTRRPLVRGGDIKQATDGKIGLHVEGFPEQAALLRWQRHEFEAVERLVAKRWRDELATQNLNDMVALVEPILPSDRKISDLEQLKQFIDGFCASRDRRVIPLALTVLGVSEQEGRSFRKRWEKDFKRPLDRFVPYTTHVLKVDLLFYLGIARGFISGERASNRADMAYLYYLPFVSAFASGDGLHARTVPLFAGERQTFLQSKELKAALREMDEHYDRLPADIKKLGVLAFASWPPSTLRNAVTSLWDQNMRPDWREIASEREATLEAPRNEAAERRTVDDLNAQIDEAVTVEDEGAALGADGPDYYLLKRWVPVKKGKWRMVSKEIEDADSGS
jgi:hypothetical protein